MWLEIAFPPGALPDPFTDVNDGFVAKLNSSGILQWNTFMGGHVMIVPVLFQ